MNTNSSHNLESQIENARRSISSDGYPMSIGELTNLYRDKELKIRPEFQRLFRWSEIQKSRLIESLLLGIPLPSIFVAQTEKGTWELVDGLQRVSTILEAQGELLDQEGKKLPALILRKTKYLPALEGRSWINDDPTKSLSDAQRLDIKRSKLDVKIIKRDSSPEAKFDLFQRLNSYGSTLTPQEIRSALLVATSSDCYSWLENLSRYPSFVQCTSLSERLLEERFDLELVIRFLVLHAKPADKLTVSSLRDFAQVLDDESVALASRYPAAAQDLECTFCKTFDFISSHGEDNVLRRWDPVKHEFRGSFLVTAFEVFAMGIGYHISINSAHKTNIVATAKEFWGRPDMQGGFATGRSTERRISEFVPLGRELMAAAQHQDTVDGPQDV